MSTSQDKSYINELLLRQDLLAEKYLSILTRLDCDLEKEDLQKFSLHMQSQETCFSQLMACGKTIRGTGVAMSEQSQQKLREIQSRQKNLINIIHTGAASLQGRLKNGTFRVGRNRVFCSGTDNASFIDISG